MALCGYCGKVEIAWHQVARRWVACEAQRDAAGVVMKAAVRSGTRTIMRPVPDPAKAHYPIPHGIVATGEESWCQSWTPEGAASRPKRKGSFKRAHMATVPTSDPARWITPKTAPTYPETGVYPVTLEADGSATIKLVSGIPVADLSAAIAADRAEITAPVVVEDLREMDPWERAEALIHCKAVPTRVLLWGPPGTGKTELPWRIAQAEKWEHVYQLMTEETPATELLGHLIVQAGSTAWCDGTLGRAIRMSHAGPVVYVIDEVGRSSQDALSACLVALTNPESLRLTLRSGEVLSPKVENWHVVATSNDEPGMLPLAVQDRLHLAVNVNTPHPGLVASLTTEEARRLVQAKSREYSIRAILTYDRMRASGMGLVEAARLVWDGVTAQSFIDAARLGGMFAAAPVGGKMWKPCSDRGHGVASPCCKCGGPCCGVTHNSDIGCYGCAVKAGRKVSWRCDANPDFWTR